MSGLDFRETMQRSDTGVCFHGEDRKSGVSLQNGAEKKPLHILQ